MANDVECDGCDGEWPKEAMKRLNLNGCIGTYCPYCVVDIKRRLEIVNW